MAKKKQVLNRDQKANLSLKVQGLQAENLKLKSELEERDRQYYNNFFPEMGQKLDQIAMLETQRENLLNEQSRVEIGELKNPDGKPFSDLQNKATKLKGIRLLDQSDFQLHLTKEQFLLFLKHKKQPFAAIWKEYNEHKNKIAERYQKEVQEVISS